MKLSKNFKKVHKDLDLEKLYDPLEAIKTNVILTVHIVSIQNVF